MASEQGQENNPYIDDELINDPEQYMEFERQHNIKQNDETKNDKNKQKEKKKKKKKPKMNKRMGTILRMTKIPNETSLEIETIKNLFGEYNVNIHKIEIVDYRSHSYSQYHPCSVYIEFDSNESRENAMKYVDNFKQTNGIKKSVYNLKYSSWQFKEKKPPKERKKNKITIKKIAKLKIANIKSNDDKKSNNDNDDDEKKENEVFEMEIDGFIDDKQRQKQLEFKRAIVFVIDVSGSMGGGRINAVRNSVIPFVANTLKKEEEILIKLVAFSNKASSYDIDNVDMLYKRLSAGGGTDFFAASKELVKISRKLVRKYSIEIILLSDGQVDKNNAFKAHQDWKSFVNNKYLKLHDIYPFVECIGIGLNHDADILDGFICNDEYGNYTQTMGSNEISIALNRSSMDAICRIGYKLKIEAGFPMLINLYTQQLSNIHETYLTESEYLRKLWLYKKDINTTQQNVIKLNDQNVIIAAMIDVGDDEKEIDDEEEEQKEAINEVIISYYHQLLKDMIDHLREFKDVINLKNESQKIQSKLYELQYIFKQIISNKDNINVLQHEGDKINVIDKLNDTLNALKLLLIEIIDSQNINLQEIRQKILTLHFKQRGVNKENKSKKLDDLLDEIAKEKRKNSSNSIGQND